MSLPFCHVANQFGEGQTSIFFVMVNKIIQAFQKVTIFKIVRGLEQVQELFRERKNLHSFLKKQS